MAEGLPALLNNACIRGEAACFNNGLNKCLFGHIVGEKAGALALHYDTIKSFHIITPNIDLTKSVYIFCAILSNTLAKLSRNETVSMDIIVRICRALECSVDDIMDILPETRVRG